MTIHYAKRPTVSRNNAVKNRRRIVGNRRRVSRSVKGVVRIEVAFEQFKLPNGLTVILRRDSSVPVVAVNICYHVGSKNEKPGKTGFAHLFEHLMFEGSENVKKGEFDRHISLAGGYNNAYTTEDVTNYYEVLPSNQLPLALWLESDRMLKFSVTEEALDTQREVVKEEKRWRVDNRPYGDVTERLQSLIFPDGQYHWPVIGSMKDLDAAAMSDVRAFYEQYYTPSNAILSISGDINLRNTEKLVDLYFSGFPAGRADPVEFVDRPLAGEIVDNLKGDVPAEGVFAAYKVPAEGTREFYELNQLARLLSDGNSSRLYKRLVYDMQAVSEFDASVEGLEKAGIFLFSAFVAPGHTSEEVLGVFDDELGKLAGSLVSAYEFEKARNSTLSTHVARLSANSGVAESLAHFHALFSDAGMINTEIDRELSVERKSIREAAAGLLVKEKRVVIHYRPEKTEDPGRHRFSRRRKYQVSL